MAGHNPKSTLYGCPNHLQAIPSHSECLLGLKRTKHPKRHPPPTLAVEMPAGSHAQNTASSRFIGILGGLNEEELKKKARDRMSRLRGKALDDPELAKTQAEMKRAHDATYREKHKKRIQFKATLKLFDAQWKKHGGPPPRPPDKPDFTQEFQWFEEDRWRNSMPVHLRAKQSVPLRVKRDIVPSGQVLAGHCPLYCPPLGHVNQPVWRCDSPLSFSPSMTPDYYCYPPVHQHRGWDETLSPHVWLVTDPECPSPGPGLYTSWHRVQAVTEGRHEPVYFERQEDAYPEWHFHCRRGEHPHPVDPDPSNARPPFNYEQPPSTTPQSAALPSLHFAVRGGELVYNRLEPAIEQYLRLSAAVSTTELMATDNPYKAVFFARGAGEAAAELLAAGRSDDNNPFSTGSRHVYPEGHDLTRPRNAILHQSVCHFPPRLRRAPAGAPNQVGEETSRCSGRKCLLNADDLDFGRVERSGQGGEGEAKERRARASTARRAAIAGALSSTPKGQGGMESGQGGKGKGKLVQEDDAEETDYDLDGEFLKIASDWVPHEDRFDPATENKPRDDA
ncbi:hypothetical protein B0H16DRAFT_1470396 [Mycena metata]|uniref:Uncharacterized protein n=1 Tax=Mycena metata TaxID=1033252 RepID=A0AAD7MQL9_9AGAR|nr:hypothetical protein B0H16DRAFT_1470396 [Mycena metata]